MSESKEEPKKTPAKKQMPKPKAPMSAIEIAREAQEKLKVRKERLGRGEEFLYYNLDDILNAVKPIINPLGGILLFSEEFYEIGRHVFVKSMATLVGPLGDQVTAHSSVQQSEDRAIEMDDPQISGSAISYARKEAAGGLFAISDDVDPDAGLAMAPMRPEPQYPKGKFIGKCNGCGAKFKLDGRYAHKQVCSKCGASDWEVVQELGD